MKEIFVRQYVCNNIHREYRYYALFLGRVHKFCIFSSLFPAHTHVRAVVGCDMWLVSCELLIHMHVNLEQNFPVYVTIVTQALGLELQ